jgi:uncharacterized protein GlcG (DUF336 family)
MKSAGTSIWRYWKSRPTSANDPLTGEDNMNIRLKAAAALLFATFGAQAQEATFTTKSLTPETALTAAQAALAQCRKNGYQVAVAVVDKSGLPQVLLRDRYAGAHTVEVSVNKAWTAVSVKTPTATLAEETQPGKPMSGLRSLPRFIAAGGGQVIEGAGALLGGIGVSGAPGGEADDACARAGIKAIAESLEF